MKRTLDTTLTRPAVSQVSQTLAISANSAQPAPAKTARSGGFRRLRRDVKTSLRSKSAKCATTTPNGQDVLDGFKFCEDRPNCSTARRRNLISNLAQERNR